MRRCPPTASLRLACCALLGACSGGQQLGRVGDLPLGGGGVVPGCTVGYRTFGELDAARSNAVLLLPWHLGTSRDLAGEIGRGRLIDSGRWFVIAVDALGNGVSSSPSNAPLPAGAAFPQVSIADLVESQHRLLTRVLGLERLHAVVGTSMGGMQALQWAVAHPGFAARVVSIAGTPATTSADRDRLRAEVARLRARGAGERFWSSLRSGSPRSAFQELRLEVDDWALQAEAIASFDAAARFGGSLERAAAELRARLLLAVSPTDQVVDPRPSRRLAELAGAELLELDGRCGHQAPVCDRARLVAAVSAFLAR